MAQVDRLNVHRGEVIPDLTLPGPSGREISTRDFYLRRNLVLAILPRQPGPGWNRWVERLGRAAADTPRDDAAILLIVPRDLDAGLEGSINELPNSVRLLYDDGDLAGRRFGMAGQEGLLIVTDRYGVAFVLTTGDPEDPGIDPAGIPGWVEFISCQCS